MLEKIKSLAKERNEYFSYIPSRGKGSHGRICYGERFTTIPNIRKELSKGTLNAVLKQLNIRLEELNR